MTKRVLVVDDVNFNIEFESKLIKNIMDSYNMDIQVDEALSVEDAKKKIDENSPYDAMIIDMNLSDGSGIDIAKYAREKSDDTRVAAITIYPNDYENEKKYFDLFMKKPIMVESFRQNFIRLLGLNQK